jgi:uncharacterized protein (DUF2132 family)
MMAKTNCVALFESMHDRIFDVLYLTSNYQTMPSNDPLHAKTLEMILNELVEHFGWDELGSIIDIRCFKFDPSVKSSLAFLRKTPWARKKVEDLYVSIKRH